MSALVRALLAAALRRVTSSTPWLLVDRLRHGRPGRYIWESRRIYGWMRGVEAVALLRAALDLPDDPTIVEVGSFLGCSTVLLGGACQLRGQGRVHAIDPFDASGDAYSEPHYRSIAAGDPRTLRERFETNLARARVRDRVELHLGTAESVAAGWSGPVDLLLLDGDQSIAGARSAYEAWLPFLRRGGTIAVHNSVATDPEHDGSRVLAESEIRSPLFRDVRLVSTLTLARRA